LGGEKVPSVEKKGKRLRITSKKKGACPGGGTEGTSKRARKFFLITSVGGDDLPINGGRRIATYYESQKGGDRHKRLLVRSLLEIPLQERGARLFQGEGENHPLGTAGTTWATPEGKLERGFV